MPIRQGASHRMRRQIVLQPLHLRLTRVAAPHVPALAVEHYNVPSSQLITVVTALRIAGRGPEVVKVRRSSRCVKFMITGRWARPRLHATPSSLITLKIL